MSKVLITGGAGFISSHVAGYLGKQGFEVHVADRLSYAGKIRNVAGNCPDAKLWMGDLKSSEFCDKLAAIGFDAVIHAAGNTHVDHSIKDPISFTLDNVLATNQLLHAFEKTPTRFVIYSTDEVYGSTPAGCIFDESTSFNPSNAYAASKVGIEGLARAYFVTFGMGIVVVRSCNTYGRGQHPEKAIPRFTRQCLKGEPITVHNDGSGSRDWLHTHDHARAIRLLMEQGQPGQAYNLARGEEHTDLEVATRIAELCHTKPNILFVPGRPGHDRRYWMDGTKIRTMGWAPEVPFDWGLRDAVEWTIDNQDWWEHDYVVAANLVSACSNAVQEGSVV